MNTSSSQEAPAPELYNSEAERALLAQALLDSSLFRTTGVQPSDFGVLLCAEGWGAAQHLLSKGYTPDMIPLADELVRRGVHKTAADAMIELTLTLAGVPPAGEGNDPAGIARVVKDWSHRRRAVQAASRLIMEANRDGPFDGTLRDTVKALADVQMQGLGEIAFSTADEVAAFFGEVTWAWPGWLPYGHLSLVAGPQGHGKSFLAARLIATFAGALPTWPDGSPFEGEPGPVLIAETEELRGVYVSRLDAMGVNRSGYVFGPGDVTHIPDLIKEGDALEKLAREQGAVALVVDSLSGGHGLDENSSAMRSLLQGLALTASRLHIPVILVHHARKRNPLEPVAVTLDRVRGSSTITQFARSVLALYRLEESQTAPVRLEVIKSTFCAPPKPIGFTITGQGLQFCEAPELAKPESQLDKACDLLSSLLEKGPVAQTVLEQERAGAGIGESTWERAKTALGIVAHREGVKGQRGAGRWLWALPAPQG
jgi:hypothetical protein